ncbi:Deleted in malignant brain tumors 1 protein [Liparis tanakae]|uniref:Deleted in malignant brain tumors 1 protein n=1 Tax=Liparis tanakae TaxID=230148 RepID=A0A4Z2GID6_9TELE|nr:Deleted in malignant brain tumors 1 protein [Liparis tanakae]
MGIIQQRNLRLLAIDAQIRLVWSGSTRCSGRVEIRHNGVWGTVCDDGWDFRDATVVCRQLNCGQALSAPRKALFGQGTGQIWLDEVGCSGTEGSLTECGHKGFGVHHRNHYKDAGVVCSGSFPKPSISMRPVGGVTWGQGANITCSTSSERLGGTFILQQTSGSFSRSQTSSTNSAAFNLLHVDLGNEGSYTCRYQITVSGQDFSSPLSDSVRLSVAVPLQQPSISLASPDGGLVWGPRGAEVTRGYGCVFTCSISSRYPGGVFSLISSDSGLNDTKQALAGSASFDFPVTEYEHLGEYSCVYEVTLSARRFTSTTNASIALIIKIPWGVNISVPLKWGVAGEPLNQSEPDLDHDVVEVLKAISGPGTSSPPDPQQEAPRSLLRGHRVPLVPLVSSVAVVAPLLVLLVLVPVGLVCRRRRRAGPPVALDYLTPAVIHGNDDDNNQNEDQDHVYTNIDPTDTEMKLSEEEERADEEESYDCEEPESNGGQDPEEEEGTSEDEAAYGNVTQLDEPTVDIYGELEDIYQNV